MAGDGRWHARTVLKILTNEVYVGKLVQGKTKIVNNKQQVVPLDDLIKVENTHESIISTELFEKVQKILCRKARKGDAYNKKPHEPYTPNFFVGRIFCAHCGSPLNRKKNHSVYIFRCITKYSAPRRCIGNSIKEDALNKEISNQLVRYIEKFSKGSFRGIEHIQHDLE
jgi:hypothetical protein